MFSLLVELQNSMRDNEGVASWVAVRNAVVSHSRRLALRTNALSMHGKTTKGQGVAPNGVLQPAMEKAVPPWQLPRGTLVHLSCAAHHGVASSRC